MVALRTTGGVVSCGAVAVAGGAWTPRTRADELAVSLPVAPRKGQIVHLRVEGADSGRWPIVQPVAHRLPGVVARGAASPAAAPFEDAGFDPRPTAGGLAELLRECLLVAPGLAEATVADVRVGLRPVTPDDLPVLGPLPG